MPWAAIYADWPDAACDLAQTYGVHWHLSLGWPWPVIRGYVEGILSDPSTRLYRKHIAPLIGGR